MTAWSCFGRLVLVTSACLPLSGICRSISKHTKVSIRRSNACSFFLDRYESIHRSLIANQPVGQALGSNDGREQGSPAISFIQYQSEKRSEIRKKNKLRSHPSRKYNQSPPSSNAVHMLPHLIALVLDTIHIACSMLCCLNYPLSCYAGAPEECSLSPNCNHQQSPPIVCSPNEPSS